MGGLDNTYNLGKEIVGSLILNLLGIGSIAHVALAPRFRPGAYNWMMIALGRGLGYGLAFQIFGNSTRCDI